MCWHFWRKRKTIPGIKREFSGKPLKLCEACRLKVKFDLDRLMPDGIDQLRPPNESQ